MKINKEGTVFFSFDTEENPKAFKEPNFINWVDFEIDDNKGIITSIGQTLSVKIFVGTDDEFLIFKTNILPEKGLNKIAVAWSPSEIKLFMNGEKIESINPNDFKP
ncbi:hypothetical protein [Polaribacter gangjinensis]|uniref:Uncharacterized protein n=1 Tax=Polaribacter gangjinensis TaxID=574710 RepID=A0A2S7W9B4_9FLAO|nr:hypothetical protein [Polaribacter gangjinensis]PQJ74173.1 hypothetical protein BTO13_02285 [Polaribacter gangjinensis]